MSDNRNSASAISDAAIVSPRQRATSAARGAFERRLVQTVGTTFERASWDACRRLGACLGLAYFAAGWRRRELAVANVQMALGLNRARALRVARRSAQNWGMTTCEFLHLPGASAQQIRDYVSLDGMQHLQGALQQGNGVIILTAHLGNWEALTARLAQEVELAGIVRPLSNAAAQERMTRVRTAYGLRVISKHAGGRPALKTLHDGGALVILPDRHAGRQGALLPLFGRPTRFETAPARLAVASGAPIVPAFGVRRQPWLGDGRIEGRILPAFAAQSKERRERDAATVEGTRQVIACIEDMVRAHPDQWSWMLRRWRNTDTDETA